MLISVCADISHYQGQCDFQAARADSLLAVIVKATEGSSLDARFTDYEASAQAAGLLRAAYHFGTGDDVPTQAEAFLKAAGDLFQLALDYEREPPAFQRPTMNIDQAAEFLEYVEKVDGRSPMTYGGDKLRQDIAARPDLWSVFAKSPYWAPAYGRTTPIMVQPWSTWSLHQYSGDGVVARNPDGSSLWRTSVKGIGSNLDLNNWNGSEAGLHRFFGAPPC